MIAIVKDFVVMTSGAFTAAHFALLPRLEELLGREVVTATTSMGLGDTSIESRLQRGERAELVIVSQSVLDSFESRGIVKPGTITPLAESIIGLAVRSGAPAPDISSVEALKKTLLAAASVGYSASVSGKYLTTELYQRLGIEDEMLPKSIFAGGGVRAGSVCARGDVEIAVQQMSELLPIEGIDHITPLPEAVQRKTVFAAGIGHTTMDEESARRALAFLGSEKAHAEIAANGLTPIW
jgi:molybdate transport system substrate-binding protein